MSTTFGHLMKHWRGVRRYSQLALSGETGLSSRHISFLETGRAKPSRNSVLTLARALEMPKTAVNDALLAAGFSPEFPVMEPTDHDLQPLLNAIQTILENHAPMPAVVVDGQWQIVGGNAPAMHMMQFLPFQGSLCTVDALLNDDPDNPVFLNWETIVAWTLTRLQIETAREGKEGPLYEIYRRLAADPRCANADTASFRNHGPYLPLHVRVQGQTLSLFTMIAEFTTAQEIAVSEQRVELFFPADARTRAYFETLE